MKAGVLKTTFFILIAVTLFPYCGKNIKSQKGTDSVLVKEFAPNDLCQVMIFVIDSEGNDKVYYKDFFAKEKNSKQIKKEINKYLDFLEKYRGKEARIKFSTNKTGNYIILKIY